MILFLLAPVFALLDFLRGRDWGWFTSRGLVLGVMTLCVSVPVSESITETIIITATVYAGLFLAYVPGWGTGFKSIGLNHLPDKPVWGIDWLANEIMTRPLHGNQNLQTYATLWMVIRHGLFIPVMCGFALYMGAYLLAGVSLLAPSLGLLYRTFGVIHEDHAIPLAEATRGLILGLFFAVVISTT